MTFLEKLKPDEWSSPSKQLKDPLVFRMNDQPYIIRTLRKVRDRIMAKLEMDDDNLMRPFDELPWNIQQMICERIN